MHKLKMFPILFKKLILLDFKLEVGKCFSPMTFSLKFMVSSMTSAYIFKRAVRKYGKVSQSNI